MEVRLVINGADIALAEKSPLRNRRDRCAAAV